MRRGRRRFFGLLVLGLVGCLSAAFVTANAAPVVAVVGGLGSIDWRLMVVGLGLSGIAMANRGLLNRAAHRAVGLSPTPTEMARTAAVGFAAQKIVRSAGAAGLAVFVRHGQLRGDAAARVVAACALTAASAFLALGVLLAATVAALAASGRLTGWWIAAALGFAMYSIVVATTVVVIVRSRRLAFRLWSWADRTRCRLPRRRSTAVRGASRFPDELYTSVACLHRRPAATGLVLAHAVAGKLLGASMLVASAAAVGLPVTIVTLVVIYATALATAMVSIVPGGLGAVEASTATMLIGAGATASAAALAVALFRVLDLWLPVVTGAVLGRGELRRRPATRDAGGSGAGDLGGGLPSVAGPAGALAA